MGKQLAGWVVKWDCGEESMFFGEVYEVGNFGKGGGSGGVTGSSGSCVHAGGTGY